VTEPHRRRRGVVRSFLFGGVVGGLVAVAAPRVRRGLEPRDRAESVAGLEAFEGAPCWEHDRGRPAGGGDAGPDGDG
jgi:hypothetical protein